MCDDVCACMCVRALLFMRLFGSYLRTVAIFLHTTCATICVYVCVRAQVRVYICNIVFENLCTCPLFTCVMYVFTYVCVCARARVCTCNRGVPSEEGTRLERTDSRMQ